MINACADLQATRAGSKVTMADQWEQLKRSVRDFLPPEVAGHEAAVIAVAIVTSLLAFLGEQWTHIGAFQHKHIVPYTNLTVCVVFSVAVAGVWKEE